MQTTTAAAANPLTPARCVFDFNDGHAPAVFIMPPSLASAAKTLADTSTNKRALLRTPENITAGGSCAKPTAADVSARLRFIADALSALGHGFRTTRWQGKPTPRLEDMFFPKSDSAGCYASAVISELAWTQDAAQKLGAPGHEQARADVMTLIRTAYHYPNISPRTEARLAAKGHTTAEYITLLACTVAARIAQALQQVKDPAYARLHTDAQEAYALLNEAKAVIDDGVAYTLQIDELH